MSPKLIDMSNLAFVFVNVPLIFLNLLANIFFAYCLIFPPHNRQGVKQPLKILLGFLIGCTIVYFISLTIMVCELLFSRSFELQIASFLLVLYNVYINMTSYVWLNFYYYTQIVPAQRALVIWVKKNIKSIIYMVLFLDRMVFLLDSAACFAGFIIGITEGNASYIGTMTGRVSDDLYYTCRASLSIITGYTFLCLCITMVSSFSTVRYLHRHMRSMAMSGSSFSSPRLHSQMRVTIIGILQGVLFFLYYIWNRLDTVSFAYSKDFFFGARITYTVTTLYMSGTTVNLCVGQAVFRQKAVDVWTALKSLCVDRTATNDVKLPSNQLTSLETVANDAST